MGIEARMCVEENIINALPESPYKQKLTEIRHDAISPELDKDNELLQFMIAHISPDEYLESVGKGLLVLFSKVFLCGGTKYIKGKGFHPCQYGFGKYKSCVNFHFQCGEHHRYFSKQMLKLYADKEYVRKCVEKFKK